jgi:hypothetical protein
LNIGGWSTSATADTNLYIDSVVALKDTRLIGDGDALRKLFNVNSGYTEQLAEYNISAPKLTVAAGKSGTLKTGRGNGTDRLYESGDNTAFRDISGFTTMKARIYNTTADASSVVHLGVYTQPDATGNYYIYDVPLDWTGWKTVTVDLDKPTHNKLTAVTDTTDEQYNPRTHMEGFAVNMGAWHTNPSDMTIYVDSVWFDKDAGGNVILDASDETSVSNMNLTTTEILGVKAADFQGTGEAVQKYNSTRKTLLDLGITKDWSGYDKLSMLVYANDYEEGDVLEIVPYVSGSAYYIYKLPVDWDGWKEIQIPLADFEQVGDISRNKIEKFILSYAKYADSQTSDSEDLCFDKIVLQKNGDDPLTGVVTLDKNNKGVYEIKGTFLTDSSDVPFSVIASEQTDGVFTSATVYETASTNANRADINTTYKASSADAKIMVWSGAASLKPLMPAFER